MSNGDLVSILNTESWRDVRSQVLVSLLVTGVFGNEVEVFSADDESSVHLGGDDGPSQDPATDRNETGERALLVCCGKISICFLDVANFCARAPCPLIRGPLGNHHSMVCVCPLEVHTCVASLPVLRAAPNISRTDVASFNGGLGCAETQSDVLVPSSSSLADGGGLRLGLRVQEDVGLLLESALALDGQFGGHGCGWVVKSRCRSRRRP